MSTLLAWRILLHEKGRNALAVAGIFIAILMIFLQLGFYASVPRAGMLVYNQLAFDIMLTSSDYVFQEQSYDFPRQRLDQALSIPDVANVSPMYQGEAQWLNTTDRLRRDVFVMGFRLEDDSVSVPDIRRQRSLLRRNDTVLVDSMTLPMYGPQVRGHVVEIADRAVEIAGTYLLGTGFLGLGAVVTSDLNFVRIFPRRSLDNVNLGLVTLKDGSDPGLAAARLRSMLPPDTRVFTRAELDAYEETFWRKRTSTGLVFGFGVVVSVVVGMVILYQTLATQIIRHLPQYATFKAIGYTDGFLQRVVLSLALITAGVAFVPALATAVMAYDKLRTLARLPIEMTPARVAVVLVIALTMSGATALLAVSKVRRVDPADLF
jgi:putative ABC transport system permease protein